MSFIEMFINIIAKRSYIVIIFWIIALLITIPVFLKINDVVIYDEESMLPENIESIRASDLQRSIVEGDLEKEIIFVDDVDLDNIYVNLKIIDLFEDLNRSLIYRYVESLEGYPYVVSSIYKSLNKSLRNTILNISNLSDTLFEGSINISSSLSNTVETFKDLNDLINISYNIIIVADREYSNLTDNLIDLSSSASVIRELDRQYYMLTSQIRELIFSVPYMVNGIKEIDLIYLEATSIFEDLAIKANYSIEIIKRSNMLYNDLYRIVKDLSIARSIIFEIISERQIILNLTALITKTWWDIARTYFYYSIDPANYYELTNLTIINNEFTPLQPETARLMFENITYLMVNYNRSLDDAVTDVAFRVLIENNLIDNDPISLYIVSMLRYVWVESLQSYKIRNNISCLTCILQTPTPENPVAHIESQLMLFESILNIGRNSAELLFNNAPKYYSLAVASSLSGYMDYDIALLLATKVSYGNVSKLDIAKVSGLVVERSSGVGNISTIVSSIMIKYDPYFERRLVRDNISLANATAELLAYFLDRDLSISIDINTLSDIVYLSIIGEANRGNLSKIASSYIRNNVLGNINIDIDPDLVVFILNSLDPNASGLLIYNVSRLNKALEIVLYNTFNRYNISVNEDIVRRIISYGLQSESIDPADIAGISIDILKIQIINNYKYPAEYLEILIDILIKYDPLGSGAIANNITVYRSAIYNFIYDLTNGLLEPLFINRYIDILIIDPTPPRSIIANIASDIVSYNIVKNVSNFIGDNYNISPKKLAEAIGEVLTIYDPLASRIIENDNSTVISSILELIRIIDENLYNFIYSNLTRRDLYNMLFNDTYYIDLAIDIYREKIVDKMIDLFEDADMPDNIIDIYINIADKIISSWPDISNESIWMLIRESLVYKLRNIDLEDSKVSNAINKYIEDIVARSINVARGLTSIDSATSDLIINIFKDMLNDLFLDFNILISRDRDGFIVLFAPTGNSIDQKYFNAKTIYSDIASNIAKEFPNAKVYWTGQIAITKEIEESGQGEAERIRALSQILVFIVLLVVLESLAAVVIPYLGIVIGAIVSGFLIYYIALSGYVDLFNITRLLMITTAFGVGADYTAYLVTRFKEEISKHGDPIKATETSLRRAGPAIIASALTTMAGFGSLSLGWEFPLFRSLGIALPLTVGTVAVVSLTIVPAILALLGKGRWFWWPRRVALNGVNNYSYSYKESSIVMYLSRKSWFIAVLFVMFIIGGVAGISGIETSHDIRLFLSRDSPALSTVDLITEKIDPGMIYPITIAIDLSSSEVSDETIQSIEDLASMLEDLRYVQRILGPTRPSGIPLDNISLSSIYDLGGDRYISLSRKLAYMNLIISIDPFSPEALDLVEDVRNIARSWSRDSGFKIYVGGASAFSKDLDIMVNDIFWKRVLPTATVLMIIIFTVIFGGFLASLIAISIVIISGLVGIILTGFLSKLLFNSPMLWFLPQVVFTAIMGVGMDYNSFYMARAREECIFKEKCGYDGASLASSTIGRLVIGLAFIVVAAYSSLILAATPGNIQIGIAISISVITASIMASYIIAPTLIAKLGRTAWMPWGLRKFKSDT